MWQKIKSAFGTIAELFKAIFGLFAAIFDLFVALFELLFSEPLLFLMLLSPIFLIAGAVFFFFDFTVTSAVLLILGAVGVAVGIWEIFF